jgi:starch synthase
MMQRRRHSDPKETIMVKRKSAKGKTSSRRPRERSPATSELPVDNDTASAPQQAASQTERDASHTLAAAVQESAEVPPRSTVNRTATPPTEPPTATRKSADKPAGVTRASAAPEVKTSPKTAAKTAAQAQSRSTVQLPPSPQSTADGPFPAAAQPQAPAAPVEPMTPLPRPPAAEPAPGAEAEVLDTGHQESARAPEAPAVATPTPAQRASLFVVHIAPEMAPVAKVGGLADVVFGLTRELAIRGNHVEIILPKYDTLRYDHIIGLQRVYDDLSVPWYDGAVHCSVYCGMVYQRKCYFIEPHSADGFFSRGAIYGQRDDLMRFVFFSRAAMEFLFKSGKNPDVIHCHDWQTALVPVLLYEIYQRLGMTRPRVCLTIHNFKHQGVAGAELLRATGLHRPERFFTAERLADNHHRNALNLLKGGIVYANFITTVSPRYAFETTTSGEGFGLEATLHTHHVKYGGVVNGIDYEVWNPQLDTHIALRYDVDSLVGKYDNKRALRHRLLLADNDKPLVAFIGRLDPQKGLELVRHAIFYALEHGAQFVLLGSSPDEKINADFWALKRMLNDSPDCHLEIGFDEDLAHLIYAGADLMVVPSRFEPCGLTQLIALRYGTIPVVRAVGGLADTVFDKDRANLPLHQRNGYVFDSYDQPGLESALGRALACYYHHPAHFRHLMENAMRNDYSWNRPGQDYLNIYDYIRVK